MAQRVLALRVGALGWEEEWLPSPRQGEPGGMGATHGAVGCGRQEVRGDLLGMTPRGRGHQSQRQKGGWWGPGAAGWGVLSA